jgi:general secretion pathway protein K
MKSRRHRSEAGVVLIAVLGGILILTIIVFALANSVRGAADELQNRKEHLQAYYLARGGIFTSAWLLAQASPAADAPIHPGQQSIEWQQGSAKVHVDLTDETGKIDLNQVQEPLLEKLLMALGYELETARPLATAIVDWRNPSSLARWESAQTSSNPLEYDPSHVTQTRYAAIEELLQVPGMKPEIYYGRYVRHDDGKIVRLPGLSECVTVDSGTGQININYAPYAVLVATTGMNTEAADYIVAGRTEKPFASAGDITSRFPASTSGDVLSSLSTQLSDRFTLLATGQTSRGIVARIRVVVSLQNTTTRPFQILRWKDAHVQ